MVWSFGFSSLLSLSLFLPSDFMYVIERRHASRELWSVLGHVWLRVARSLVWILPTYTSCMAVQLRDHLSWISIWLLIHFFWLPTWKGRLDSGHDTEIRWQLSVGRKAYRSLVNLHVICIKLHDISVVGCMSVQISKEFWRWPVRT